MTRASVCRELSLRPTFFETLCSFGLCHHPRVALLTVADDRAAHPPGERRGAHRARQPQGGLDLSRELVPKVEKPATGKRHLRRNASRPLVAPPGVERRQKTRVVGATRAFETQVAVQAELFARERQQQVVPPDRRSAADALEQHGVAIGVGFMKLEQCIVVQLQALGCALV